MGNSFLFPNSSLYKKGENVCNTALENTFNDNLLTRVKSHPHPTPFNAWRKEAELNLFLFSAAAAEVTALCIAVYHLKNTDINQIPVKGANYPNHFICQCLSDI